MSIAAMAARAELPKHRKMVVKPLYMLTVGGSRVELEFDRGGGIESIKVSTDNLRPRFFALKDYPNDEVERPSYRNTHITWLAQAICTFVFTGLHPTDRGFPGYTEWGSVQSRDFAEQMIARILDESWEEHGG